MHSPSPMSASALLVLALACAAIFAASAQFIPSPSIDHNNLMQENDVAISTETGMQVATAFAGTDSDMVLDMVALSQAVYVLHRNEVQSCQDGQRRNKTLINSLREEWGFTRNPTGNSSDDGEEEPQDLFRLLLPNGTECLHYSLDDQVLVVRSDLRKYVAVAYAGTDDWKSALTDGDILTSDFGPARNETNSTQGDGSIFQGMPEGVRVHRGFNSKVFGGGYEAVMECVASARLGGTCGNGTAVEIKGEQEPYQIYTTGHSLGAADSVLLGAALHLTYPDETLMSINFGCPKIGNTEWAWWMDSLQPKAERESTGSFSIFRFVNKIDLVPRLPELVFTHAGHTLQMSVGGDIKAYWNHVGNEDLGYAGVPYGWEAAPYAFLPGALVSHISKHYVAYLTEYQPNATNATNALYYVRDFERVEGLAQIS